MPRRQSTEAEISVLLRSLSAAGEGAPGPAQRLQLLRSFRGQSTETDLQIDEFFVRETAKLRKGLQEAQKVQDKLKKLVEKLAAPPWHPAVFLAQETTSRGPAAMVCHGSSRRVVTFADEVDVESLCVGDEVLLGPELNVVVAKSPYRSHRAGETAIFDRYTPDGRIVLSWRDEEIVVDPAGSLADLQLKAGDLVRWERSLWLAFEKLERSKGEHLFLEETPTETFDDIGGLDAAIGRLQRALLLHFQHPDAVRKYRLRPKLAALLHGPPGNGKTMIARALVNWLGQLSSSGKSRFMNIKPSSLHSMWYAQSEANYREAFRIARAAAEQEPEVPVVMFFDEVDSIGAARSDSLTRVDDRVLPAFMAELEGLESRGNVFVIAATNRPDALDPALVRPGRLKDLVLEIPRPNMEAARSIFCRYLREDMPFATNDPDKNQSAARGALIGSAVSRIFSPNGESELAKITFRDGKQRRLKPKDLVSGASIAKISMDAAERACLREIETGQPGVCLEDLLWAIDEEFSSAAEILTPRNCGKYLGDLPDDVDVVSVEPVRRKAPRAHRYLRIA